MLRLSTTQAYLLSLRVDLGQVARLLGELTLTPTTHADARAPPRLAKEFPDGWVYIHVEYGREKE
jgi:hypothetical protein